MKRTIPVLRASLTVSCPECGKAFDLFNLDDPEGIVTMIFQNRWDEIPGFEIDCPECPATIQLDEVEW